ncbi:MAG: hypothetical protein XD87_0393 [candidate division WS6 bacterium 36_33]|uniref:Transmembrane(S)protein n=1 Tax=candidate division WS6 bacterium 36_33 TaxID=1641388 RepID=A0A117LTR8_9BACT|nr:MAG: hypothetical protein XD87_0393 [candidate division WS6 bacterium 36_33]
MDIIKKATVPLIMLLLVVVVWVGLYIYYESSEVEINPLADSYVSQLQNSFDLEELEEVSRRTKDHFPVLPEVFFTLIGRD